MLRARVRIRRRTIPTDLAKDAGSAGPHVSGDAREAEASGPKRAVGSVGGGHPAWVSGGRGPASGLEELDRAVLDVVDRADDRHPAGLDVTA